jgi:hypothetical protein
MNDGHDLELLLKSHLPLIVIESYEEPHLLQLISRIGLQQYKPVYRWSITDGLKRIDLDLASAVERADAREGVVADPRQEGCGHLYPLRFPSLPG